ncbi:unnamed protein product [Coregonus sp. 'balchen']|nr:unnamed protein product [Coregonus sp. 'balchen']
MYDCEMLESNNLVTFEGLVNSSAYHTFLLDEEKGRLVVGAKDHIFSFNLVNISRDLAQIPWPASTSRRDECKWAGKDLISECSNFIKVLQPFNQTHLYVCGTGAFHPVCAYLEVGKKLEDSVFRLEPQIENGRGKSPYDPKLLTASMLIDPRFVSVHLIPESDNQEDDKIYLFFRENAMDGEHAGKATQARIGQLCKNDFGGHRSLVNKWTTFLKARLVCSVPGLNGIDTHFDELQDVVLMSSKDPKNPIIYAVFTTSSNIFKGSAVCLYSMADIRRVFLGPYAHRDGPNYQWVPFQGRVPYPRPGTQQLYLGSELGVSQMPLHRCEVYGKACAECCLARDPYCAWDGTECSRYFPMAKRRTRRQDIRNGDPLTQCSDLQHHDNLNGQPTVLDKKVYGVENSSTFLECSAKSQRALTYWQYQQANDDRRQDIKADDRFVRTELGLLIRTLDKKDSGTYVCQAVEHGFMQMLLKVTLEVIDTERLDDLIHRDDEEAAHTATTHTTARDTPTAREPHNQKLWYRDFLSLVNHPTLNSVDEFSTEGWRDQFNSLFAWFRGELLN